MVIGVDISSVSKNQTGTGRYINCLVNELKTFNHDIKLIPRLRPNDKNKYWFLKQERLQRLYYKHFKLADELLKEGTDCAIFPNYFAAPGFNKPAAIVIHDLSFITHQNFYSKAFVKYYKNELKRTLALEPVIITVSRHSKNEIIKYTGMRSDNIHIVQGYSSLKPGTVSQSENEKYFLYVGHIEPRKNLTFLIENFLRWKVEGRHNIKLKLAGELWIKNKETKTLLEKYKSNKDIEFLGYVGEDKLSELYEYATAFVHTSFVEGFGFPVLEAMHHNLPVLCTKNTATNEISGPRSIKVDPYKQQELINGFDKLLDKSRNFKYSENNIPFSPGLMQRQLVPVLEKLEERNGKKFFINEIKAVSCGNAVLKTLLYSNLFNAGIKIDDLKKNIFDVKITTGKLNTSIAALLMKNKILIKNDIVFINNNSGIFYSRKEKTVAPLKLKIILKILNSLPFVSTIAFSGGTANYGLKNHNDVDVFIITKTNTVFIVYMLLHILSLIFKVRNELCANYLIDEKSINVSEHDLYTAHQIISLKPFKNENNLTYFFNKNEWVKNYFPNFEIAKIDHKRKVESNLILKPANKLIKRFYRYFYKEKLLKNYIKSIVLEDGVIKLHTNDHRIKTLKEFEKVLTNYDWHSSTIQDSSIVKEADENILAKVV